MAQRAAAQHFGDAAAAYDRFTGRWPLGALRAQERRAVRALAAVQAGQRVLDAGCGAGATLEWLASAGANAIGVDAAWAMAAACRRRGLTVSVQDVERLGLRAGFDWVLCIGALEFVENPGAAVAGLAAVLRPGGQLVLLYPRRSLLGRVYVAYHRAHGVAVRLFGHAEIGDLLAAAGLGADAARRDCLLSTVCVARRAAGT